MVDMVLEKIKAYSGDKQNEKANRIAKKEDKANVPIRVKQAWAKKEEEILDSIKEELKQKKKIDLGPNWFREASYPEIRKNI
ncbi:23398_t:CDS:2 [Gigaspora margarita]|uniref:23398_t:CDS:1 n=1 Tax=Gigaspora margarita TaxID=4874 RepID=A0ABN7VPN1_GIGMA|nr:23398_t:CDS:2 [Gigaspora margarita]